MTVNIIEKRIPFLLVVNVEIVAENGSFVNTWLNKSLHGQEQYIRRFCHKCKP